MSLTGLAGVSVSVLAFFFFGGSCKSPSTTINDDSADKIYRHNFQDGACISLKR